MAAKTKEKVRDSIKAVFDTQGTQIRAKKTAEVLIDILDCTDLNQQSNTRIFSYQNKLNAPLSNGTARMFYSIRGIAAFCINVTLTIRVEKPLKLGDELVFESNNAELMNDIKEILSEKNGLNFLATIKGERESEKHNFRICSFEFHIERNNFRLQPIGYEAIKLGDGTELSLRKGDSISTSITMHCPVFEI